MSLRSKLTRRAPTLRVPDARRFGHVICRRAVVLIFFLARVAGAQIDTTSVAPHRYLVLYRNATIPGDAEARIASTGARLTRRNEHFGIAAVESTTQQDDATTLRRLAAQPNVAYVLHDRILSAHRLRLQAIDSASTDPASIGKDGTGQSTGPTTIGRLPTHGPIHTTPPSIPTPLPPAPYDTYYTTPQSWAVQQVGGHGNNVPGGPAHGPWDTTMGKGVRIAIIDSGVDQSHPDIAPNLALNLTEVDRTAFPTPCDDGTPQDQEGHGTWTASLAAAAIGPGTGQVIGVAPAATILNIKVLQRMPAAIVGDSAPADQCEAGEASGLLSWVMQGIEDAITNRADVISLSIGATADLTTGDGAGLLAAFNQITYAAAQANIVIVASAGNDGFDLSNPRYVELPAQSRGVLAIVASTNAACAQNLNPGATCTPGRRHPRLLQQLRHPSRLSRPRRQLPRRGRRRGQRLDPRRMQLRQPQHPRWPALRLRPQLWLLQPRPHPLRPGHGHQRLGPSGRRCSRPATGGPPKLERHRRRLRHAQLSHRHPGLTRPSDQRHHRPNPIPTNPIAKIIRAILQFKAHPFIRSFTLWANFSISSAFFITSTDSISLSVLSTCCFKSVANASNLSVSATRRFCRSSLRNFSCFSARFGSSGLESSGLLPNPGF